MIPGGWGGKTAPFASAKSCEDRYTYLSPRWQQLTGYTPEELIGSWVCESIVTKDAAPVVAQFTDVKKRRESFTSLEICVRCRDGSEALCEASGYPLLTQEGELRGYRGVLRDVTERRAMESELYRKDHELELMSTSLRDVNSALRVLIHTQELERQETETKIIENINKLIWPYLEKLKLTKLDEYQRACLEIIEANLDNVASPLISQLSRPHISLTPREIQIANHIRQGLTSKEIALVMNVSPSAIELHRNHIRAKLGLNNKKINLRTYLLSLDNGNALPGTALES